MKLLQEFKEKVEEQKSDYSKFDMLVRAGLADRAQIQRIHRVLDKMKEDKPVLTASDRAIVQDLLNKMVDVVTTDKQIFQKAKQVVREAESVVDTSDYKTTPSGRKVRAHRITFDTKTNEEYELTEAPVDFDKDPPFVLVLNRKAIRLYPNDIKVAIYYNKKLDRYFSVPYGSGVTAPVQQAEEVEQVEEAVMDQLHKIVAGKQAQSVKFGDGSTRKVDHFTASAITQVHNALNDENKKKFADMVHKSAAHLAKASDFAFSRMKK